MGLDDKDAAISDVVERLRRDLAEPSFDLADHWHRDPSAIGLTSRWNARVLAYVSTWKQRPGRYYLELEVPGETEDPHDAHGAGTWDEVEYEELLVRVAAHLQLRLAHSDEEGVS